MCYNLGNRFEAAMERKGKILEIIRSLGLPNNPLDDIIDQVVSTCHYHFHELFTLHGMKIFVHPLAFQKFPKILLKKDSSNYYFGIKLKHGDDRL